MEALKDPNLPQGYRYPFLGGEYAVPQHPGNGIMFLHKIQNDEHGYKRRHVTIFIEN